MGTLVEEIKPVFTDKNHFENRDKSIFLLLFGVFGLSGF